MAKLTLNAIGSRYGSIDALNDNFDAIEQALENTLSRDGTSPNAMEADLDMNGNQILNASIIHASALVIGGQTLEPGDAVATATVQVFEFTATAGQTSFSVSPLTPASSSVLVEVNGLSLPTSSLVTSGSTLSFPALTLGDEVVVKAFTRDIGAYPAITNNEVAANAAIISTKLAFTQAGTGAVTRTAQAKMREVVSVKDFGAVGDGVADDTVALQNWANRAGLLYVPEGTYKITATITLSNETRMVFAKNAVIQTATTNISLFSATSKSKIHIEGGKFKQTAAGTSPYVAAIKLSGCADCLITGCIFEGMQWAGVMLDGCSQCVVCNNYFTGWLGTVQDAADVCVYNNCTACEVSSNMCYGGGHTGIMVQDPYAGLIPSKTLISGNRIGQHTAYGIAVYLPGLSGSGDTYNQVVNNYIENILGSYSTNRSSGAGIYIVGNWAGGTQVIGNNVYNCCQQTLDRSLSPAGISVNGIQAGVTKPIVASNTISGMTQGDGINVTTSPGGAVINSNVVRIPSTNNGTGVGGGPLVGAGIRVEISSGVEVDGNNCIVAGTGSAALIYANGASMSDISFCGGYYESPTAATFSVSQSGGFNINNLMIGNVRAKQTGSSNYAFTLSNVVGGFLSNNYGSAVAFEGLRISASTQIRVVGGSYTNVSTPSISTTGTCTGTVIDSSVFFGTSGGAISNGGTGSIVSWRSSAAPVSGSWAVGDAIQQSVPVVGQPKGWRCTVAGTPGTWVSEGNL